jgi:hypothetical protein
MSDVGVGVAPLLAPWGVTRRVVGGLYLGRSPANGL